MSFRGVVRSTVRIVGTLIAVAVGSVAVIAAVWLWEEDPKNARLVSIALLLAFGCVLSLRRWKADPKHIKPISLPNVLWPSLILGLCLWLGLGLYERQFPVPVVADQGKLLREAMISQLEGELNRPDFYKKVDPDNIPSDALLLGVDPDETVTAQIGSGRLIVLSPQASAATLTYEKERASQLVTEALRVGRRDRRICELLLQYVQKRELPEEEDRIRKLLRSTLP